jgi:hypothetical protein
MKQTFPGRKPKYNFQRMTRINSSICVPLSEINGKAGKCLVRAQSNIATCARNYGAQRGRKYSTTTTKGAVIVFRVE